MALVKAMAGSKGMDKGNGTMAFLNMIKGVLGMAQTDSAAAAEES